MRVPIIRRAFVLLALATCATATDQIQTTEHAPDDSTRARSVVVGTGQSPRAALIRSALVPGWGQLNNGHALKAVLFGGTAVGFLASMLVERDNLNHTNMEIGDARTALAGLVTAGGDDPQLRTRIAQLEGEFENQAARRNTRLLYLFTTATLAAVDAYVDAHLADFGSADTSLDVMPRSDGVSFSVRWPLPTTVIE